MLEVASNLVDRVLPFVPVSPTRPLISDAGRPAARAKAEAIEQGSAGLAVRVEQRRAARKAGVAQSRVGMACLTQRLPYTTSMHWDRAVIAYHGCDAEIADCLLAGEAFTPNENNYDWLGRGIYFWEIWGPSGLSLRPGSGEAWPSEVPSDHRCHHPAWSLLRPDGHPLHGLGAGYSLWKKAMETAGHPFPQNAGPAPDHKLRRLDCAVLNGYLDMAAERGEDYDSVRCRFVEGEPVFEGSGICQVPNPSFILGLFRPTIALSGATDPRG